MTRRPYLYNEHDGVKELLRTRGLTEAKGA